MKVRCCNPAHTDDTPSMHVYPEIAYCFVCGFTCDSKDVMDEEDYKKIKVKEKDNIEEKIKEIEKLPKRVIRGLLLPYDESNGSYYIVWPDKTFYKKRVSSDSRSRYMGPRGHKPPLFRCRSDNSTKQVNRVCIVMEGEINALSLDIAIRGYPVDIVSPGSCNSLLDHTPTYLQYNHTIIIVDKDPPGVYNGYRLKETLMDAGKSVTLIALDQDFNDLLQQGGPELVKQVFMKELGLR